jgi:ribosomal protein S18 acetylase RimI-like enzyme
MLTDFNHIKLAPATSDDIRLLYEITQISMAHMSQKSPIEQKYTEEQKRKHFQNYIDEFTPELTNTFLIHFNDKTIGRLRVVRNATNIHLGGIQILPDFTGQGIGGFIVDQIIIEANNKNQSITLLVHKTNHKAIKFYKNKHFKIVEETEKQYKMVYNSEVE